MRERLALAVPAPVPPPAAGEVLALPAPEVSASFDRMALVYRVGESTYETDAYAQLLASPRELLGEALRGHLQTAGLFRDVIRTLAGADLVARIRVTGMYGDFRNPGAPAAYLALSARIARIASPRSAPLLEKSYERVIPIPARRPEAIVAGWDHALSEIGAEIARDLREAGIGASPSRPSR